MIVFHTFPINQWLTMMPEVVENRAIVRFTLFGSPQEGALLHLLPDDQYVPTQFLMNDTEASFDYYFWKQIQESPTCFFEKMKILEPEFQVGATCLILIQTDYSYPSRVSITESLIGYFKTFYGIEPKLVVNPEDLYDLGSYSGFSAEGLYRITQEMETLYKNSGDNNGF